MNKFLVVIFIIAFAFPVQVGAQVYTEQVLNKEQFLSSASLTQDYDNDGDLDIVVSRWSPAGIYLLENDETKQFPATPIITDNLTFYIADIDMADFDNDGDMDYLVCFSDVNDGELAWFQRQNDGTYLKWTIATNKDFIMADLGDFNNDGWMDIVAVGLTNSDNQGRMYVNQANLFFTEEIIAINGIKESVYAADIDDDNDIDIAFGGSGVAAQNEGARLLLNNGDATFTIGTYLHCWGDSYNDCGSDNIQIIDLNDDGFQDIVGFSLFGTGALYWLDGSNNMDQTRIDDDNIIDIGGHFVIFDIDGNGLKDIVRSSKGRDRIAVLYQEDTLQFTRQYIDLNWDHCCNPPAQMSIGDLDNDGDMDVVFPEQGNVDHDLSWFENINGQLFKHQIHGELDGVKTPKMVDWDNDGDLDIFATVASGTIDDTEDELILYENLDGENFINWRLNDALDGAADLEMADIDGDGDLDIFATATAADDLVWLRNDGFQANWVTDTIWAEANQPLGIASDDLDGDGDADVVMCSWNDDKVLGFLNDGSGSFSPIVVDASIDGPKEVEIADLDNDGDKDIAVVAAAANSVVLYFNNGSGSFTEQNIFSGESGTDIEIADWNQDGTPDIFASFTDSDVHVVGFIHDNGSYIADTLLLQNDNVLSIKLTDLDGDGDLDLLSGHKGGVFNADPVLYANIVNEGEIENSAPLYNENGDVTAIDVGDINSDGCLDIVFADFLLDDLVLLTLNCPNEVRLDAKTFLQGPYIGNGMMNTTLLDLGELPNEQPYNTTPWNYTGTESVGSLPADVVDWVLVSARLTEDPSTTIGRTAVLLRNDGQIINPNGDNTFTMALDTLVDSLYLVVTHRNHVPLMSATAILKTNDLYQIDLRQDDNLAYGDQNGISDLGDGNYGLFAGDANGNGQVQNTDLNIFFQQIGIGGYFEADFNMNSEVQNTDLQEFLIKNIGRGAGFGL